MFIVTLITILGINIAPFVFPQVNIWHAQGFWTQMCIAIMFAWSFFKRSERDSKNIPLGLLFMWVTINVGFVCFLSLMRDKYDTVHFFPYFNFLCLLIFYTIITKYLTIVHIKVIMEGMRYVVFATIAICVLQIFNLSQFFELIPVAPGVKHDNIVTGFIGNGTHLSGFLASCFPLLLWKMKKLDVLAIIALLIVLLFTGTTIGDPSISGFAIIPLLTIFYYKRKWKVIVPLLLLLAMGAYLAYPHIPEQFFHPQSRFSIWAKYWPLFRHFPVTGVGLGSMRIIAPQVYPKATHLHLEYFEFAFELGIIGLAFILNLIYHFIKDKSVTRLQLVLKTMVLGFLLSCFFNFPAHLWLPSMYAMFAYAGYNLIKELKLWQYHPEKK